MSAAAQRVTQASTARGRSHRHRHRHRHRQQRRRLRRRRRGWRHLPRRRRRHHRVRTWGVRLSHHASRHRAADMVITAYHCRCGRRLQQRPPIRMGVRVGLGVATLATAACARTAGRATTARRRKKGKRGRRHRHPRRLVPSRNLLHLQCRRWRRLRGGAPKRHCQVAKALAMVARAARAAGAAVGVCSSWASYYAARWGTDAEGCRWHTENMVTTVGAVVRAWRHR
jgi:hypothetical protein